MNEENPKQFLHIGQSRFMGVEAIPDKYNEALEDVFANLKSIHGPAFVNHVKFLLNLSTLVKLMVNSTTLNPGVTQEQMTDGLSRLATQLAGSHAMLSRLDEELQIAAYKSKETIESIVDQYEQELNKKR